MKGIILAGGNGTRLLPCTMVINKHLLPVYDKPMIYYPLRTLAYAGIKEVLIVIGGNNPGDFVKLLKNGKSFGLKGINYEYQEGSGGIAQALSLAEDFANKEKIAVLLGDNIIEDNIKKSVEDFKTQKKGAKLFLKEVSDPERFGVAEIKGNKIIAIEEKPKKPKTKLAVTGLYMYDSHVFDVIRTLKPSDRGELEITDVNNYYIKNSNVTFEILSGYWGDVGKFDSLHEAADYVKSKHFRY
ncbi:MAG: sugar phosphate nucleotidyltransferase [Candidatus Paceibacterota bacterium]|jgi:glucose-1-phosphate thymidylyltransferase